MKRRFLQVIIYRDFTTNLYSNISFIKIETISVTRYIDFIVNPYRTHLMHNQIFFSSKCKYRLLRVTSYQGFSVCHKCNDCISKI